MGFRKYLPLKPKEIETVLKRHGFFFKRQDGSHAQWEGYIVNTRRIVTVPQYSEIKSKDVLKSIFQQSGLSWKEFYKK